MNLNRNLIVSSMNQCYTNILPAHYKHFHVSSQKRERENDIHTATDANSRKIPQILFVVIFHVDVVLDYNIKLNEANNIRLIFNRNSIELRLLHMTNSLIN